MTVQVREVGVWAIQADACLYPRSRWRWGHLLCLLCGLSTQAVHSVFAGLPGYFTDVKPVANVNRLADDGMYTVGSRISYDGLEMYMVRGADANGQDWDVWLARRNSTSEDFGEPYRLDTGVNTAFEESTGSISSDGLSLYFQRRDDPGGWNNIFVATRENTSAEFDDSIALESVNTAGGEGSAFISADSLALYYHRWPASGDLYVVTRPDVESGFGDPVALSTVNTSGDEYAPTVTADAQLLFFTVTGGPRAGGLGGDDIWFATANRGTGEFANVLNLGEPINSRFQDSWFDLSAEWPASGSLVYFTSDRPPADDPTDRPWQIWQATWVVPENVLQAGDADEDGDFDQYDLVKVQVAGKYLTRTATTWGEGDWDGAPGGAAGHPPAGNRRFDQLDIVAALAPGHYLDDANAAIHVGGKSDDGQASIVYNAGTGEVGVNAPAGKELTSVNIESASSIFTGTPAQNLGGSFDNDTDSNIFKATFGASFGSLSFGDVAEPGLTEDFVAGDLTVVGSLAGGGDLGAVDLIYVPEPASLLLLGMGLLAVVLAARTRLTASAGF